MTQGKSLFLFTLDLLAVAAGQYAQDLGARIVDFAQRSDARLDFGADVLGRAEVAALQERGLRLVRLEEIAHLLGNMLWFSVLLAKEDVDGDVLELGVDVQDHVALAEEHHDGIVILRQMLGAFRDLCQGKVPRQFCRIGFDLVDVLELAVLAVEEIDREMTC